MGPPQAVHLGGAFLAAIVLIVFPFVGVLWAAVLCLWLLDIGNNTTAEPYRAFLSDRLPKNQLARGFLTQSFYAGLGAVLANLAIFIFQKFITGEGSNGLPYWMYVCFWLGTVSIVVTIIIAMRAGPKELRPVDEEIAEIEAAPKGLGAAVKDIASAVRTMPVAMHKIGVAFLFQWYAMFIYWQFVAVSLGETIFNADPETGGEAWDEAVSWTGLENADLQLLHHDRRAVPHRLGPADRGEEGPGGLPRPRRDLAHRRCRRSPTSTSPCCR